MEKEEKIFYISAGRYLHILIRGNEGLIHLRLLGSATTLSKITYVKIAVKPLIFSAIEGFSSEHVLEKNLSQYYRQ